jgi:hypothetical protein
LLFRTWYYPKYFFCEGRTRLPNATPKNLEKNLEKGLKFTWGIGTSSKKVNCEYLKKKGSNLEPVPSQQDILEKKSQDLNLGPETPFLCPK